MDFGLNCRRLFARRQCASESIPVWKLFLTEGTLAPDTSEIVEQNDIVVDENTIARYKANYSLTADAPVTAEMVRHHWVLERNLTKRLLASGPDERAEVFESCYTTLYRECDWLNQFCQPRYKSEDLSYQHFLQLLGSAKTVYEIGSGQARLIKYLARHGYACTATEITTERGECYAEESANLEWHTSDGVNLERFEPSNHYDVAISTQVIEHIHPSDLITHLRGVREILKDGGKYIFNTPHKLFGPHDLSLVFQKDVAMCMHLKEYYYFELAAALREAGFTELKGIFLPPARMRKMVSFTLESPVYLKYLMGCERALVGTEQRTGWRPPILVLRALGFTADVFMTATKKS